MKPGTYRPTVLKMAAKHCPRAINFYNDGAPTDKAFMATGIAAHAILQAWGAVTSQRGEPLDREEMKRIGRSECERMIRDGRRFEGDPEPPLPIDDVWAGLALALKYVDRYPIEPGQFMKVEEGLAVDEEWKPAKYSKDARLRLIADQITITEEVDEEQGAKVLTVRDYKSAWPTDESELDTVQMKAQAVLAWIHHGATDIDILRQEVVNLRTGQSFTRDLWMSEYGGGGLETLKDWETEMACTMRALDDGRDEDGLYALSPGGGCIGCPYVVNCHAGEGWSQAVWSCAGEQETSREALGKAFAYYSGLADEFKARIRKLTAEEPIDIGAGKIVGTVAKEGRKVAEDAWQIIAADWAERGGDLDGLLKGMGIGVTQLDKIAKLLHPDDPGKQDEWRAYVEEESVSRRFGIHKAPELKFDRRVMMGHGEDAFSDNAYSIDPYRKHWTGRRE